jgi:SAM-dependent methyltransferase/DNA-binding HxlR family transcriptional regulator
MLEALTGTAKDVVSSEDPRSNVWEMLRAQWRFSALYAFVELDLAGSLSDGPRTVEQIAEQGRLHPVALARLLRTAASMGLVSTMREANRPVDYALTPVGETLRSDAPRSMRSVVIPQGAPDFLQAMGSLNEAVRTGKSPFASQFGSLYGYFASHPEARHHFDAHMATRSRSIAEAAVAAYDFGGISTIADIGGGVGTVLATILRSQPAMRGVLFELAPVLAEAATFLSAEGVADRTELVSGDFFAAVPAAADAYLLSNIVHNWNDEDALVILRNVRAVLPENGRVLLLDILLPEDDRPHLGKELDMRMLALYDGAQERLEGEYMALLDKAGLRPARVIELPYALSLIEAVPR